LSYVELNVGIQVTDALSFKIRSPSYDYSHNFHKSS